jgi:hypothetical protein
MAGTLKCMQQSSANPVTGIVQYNLGVDVSGAAVTLTADTTQGNCDILDIRGIRSLAVKPSGASITSLTFYGCATYNGTFVLINDIGSSGVLTTVQDQWTSVTAAALAPHAFIQMKPNTNGTVTVVAKN